MPSRPVSFEQMGHTLPDYESDRVFQGLDSDVRLYRDQWGIPHVQAQSAHDAFFGQGFATAQDRLWQMDRDRHIGYGRLAEYMGREAVDQDVTMRKFQIGPSIDRDYAALNNDARSMLEAYAEGVNARISGSDPLPIEYEVLDVEPEVWRPQDCIAVFKTRHIMMGVFEGKLWRARLIAALGPEAAARTIPQYERGHLQITPPGTDFDGADLVALEEFNEASESIEWLSDVNVGSNNWALSGSRTASGKPLLAGDPHRAPEAPNVYYQNHIACPDFDAVGLSFPGMPGFPHFGHNERVAWCVTHASADYQDLFMERFKSGESSLYELKGEWKAAAVRTEIIEVKDGDSVELDVTVTHHGPVIVGDPAQGKGIAFRYTGTAEANTVPECIYKMLQSSSVDKIEESMRDWVDPSNNFVFVDVDDNIEYLNRGKLPMRPMANAWLPVPGWSGEYDWRGYVPFDELVRSRNPETGYIVTANNKIAGGDYPHYIGLHFAPEHRARRIRSRLLEIEKATVDDMASVHAEMTSMPALSYLELLKRVTPRDDLAARAREKLVGWDGAMERNLVAPAIYSAFRLHLDRKILSHLLGPLADEALGATGRGAPMQVRLLESMLSTMARENDTSMLPPGADWKTLAAEALSEGVAYLKERFGDDDDDRWWWGQVHYVRTVHPIAESIPQLGKVLNPPPAPLSGDGDTPRSGSYGLDSPFMVTGTSVARYVFDAGDWNNSAWIVPFGSSGHPSSPHYSDQMLDWADVKLIPMLYDWERIEAESETRQELNKGPA